MAWAGGGKSVQGPLLTLAVGLSLDPPPDTSVHSRPSLKLPPPLHLEAPRAACQRSCHRPAQSREQSRQRQGPAAGRGEGRAWGDF